MSEAELSVWLLVITTSWLFGILTGMTALSYHRCYSTKKRSDLHYPSQIRKMLQVDNPHVMRVIVDGDKPSNMGKYVKLFGWIDGETGKSVLRNAVNNADFYPFRYRELLVTWTSNPEWAHKVPLLLCDDDGGRSVNRILLS